MSPFPALFSVLHHSYGYSCAADGVTGWDGGSTCGLRLRFLVSRSLSLQGVHPHTGLPATRWGDTGEKCLWIGAVDSQAGSGPEAPVLRKKTQIQILNIHKNQNGDIFDLLPTCLTSFFLFFFFFFKSNCWNMVCEILEPTFFFSPVGKKFPKWEILSGFSHERVQLFLCQW